MLILRSTSNFVCTNLTFVRASALLTLSPSSGERLFAKLIDYIEVFYRPIPLSLSSQFKMFALYANCGRYSKPYFYKLTLPYVDVFKFNFKPANKLF